MTRLAIMHITYCPISLLEKRMEAIKYSLLAEENYSDEYAVEAAKRYKELADKSIELGYENLAHIAMKEYDYWSNRSWQIYNDTQTKEYWGKLLEGLDI